MAKVYEILIASPGDTALERRAVEEAFSTWNFSVGKPRGVIFAPILWERTVVPAYGNRPQAEINKQIVDDCDALIAIFRSKFGTPTGESNSGTLEEIHRISSQKKACAIYFYSGYISLSDVDAEELLKLREFKRIARDHGVYGEYPSVDDLGRQLQLKLNSLLQSFVGTASISTMDIGMGQYEGMVLKMVSQNQMGWGYPSFHSMGPEKSQQDQWNLISATWGTGGTEVDVTDAVRQLILGGGPAAATVSSLGVDPVNGYRKTLILKVNDGINTFLHSVAENSALPAKLFKPQN